MQSIHPIVAVGGAIAFGLFMIAAGIAFAYALKMRFGQLTMGKRPDVRWDELPTRVKNVFIYVLGQARLPKNGYLYSGILHIFIFGAFVVLSVDTVNFVTEGALKSLGVFSGGWLQVLFTSRGRDSSHPYQALADTFRFLCIVGLMMAFINRTVIKPDRLPLTRDAMYTLFFILGLMVFEVTQQGFWLAYAFQDNETVHQHIWFSSLFATLVKDMDPDALKTGHQVSWWLHLVTLLAFRTMYLGASTVTCLLPPSTFSSCPWSRKAPLRKMDLGIDDEPELLNQTVTVDGVGEDEDFSFALEQPAEPSSVTLFVGEKKFRRFSFDEENGTVTIASAKVPESGQVIRVEYEPPAPAYFGARTPEDLSWKQLFDGLSCTECGRCNDNCPAAMSGSLSNR